MTRSKPESTCKTCSLPISNKSAVFNCVSCGDSMHLTPKCSGMSEKAIYGLQEIRQNVLLICNDCVQNNQRDRVLDNLASSRESPDVAEIAKSFDEVKSEISKIRAEIKSPPPEPTKPAVRQPAQPIIREKPTFDGVRFRGIPESSGKTARERYDEDVLKVKEILAHMDIDCPMDDVKRVGTYENEKTRTIIAKFSSEHHRRLVLLSAHKLATYDKPIFVSRELSPDEKKLENALLIKRRYLIDVEKIAIKDLRIRNLKLQKKENKKWIDVDVTPTGSSSPPEQN